MSEANDLSTPRIHINASCATVAIFATMNPILSVPYLQLLVAWHWQRIRKIMINELWRCMISFIYTVPVKVFFATLVVSLQLSSRWQDDHLRLSRWVHNRCMSAAPVGCRVIWVAFDRTGLVDKLHCLEKSTLCHVKGTILVISCSKAHTFCVYLLPVLWNKFQWKVK